MVVCKSVLLIVTIFLSFGYCLKRNDKGTCSATVSLPKKLVSNKAIPGDSDEYSDTDYEDVDDIVCCDGWNYYSATDTCEPECTDGCPNGICVDVEKCQCTPPYVITKNICVLPVCEKPCINGTCIHHNNCSCDPGYTNQNNTCVPECSSPCHNGECIAPNRCGNCLKGYMERNGTCEPVCDKECLHSTCVAPNTCKCEAGYKLDLGNRFICSPICETQCNNGSCVAPNKCLCTNGYQQTDKWWSCEPKCDSCNGTCVAPDDCSCGEDYYWEDNVGCIKIAVECSTCENQCWHEGQTYCCKGNDPTTPCFNQDIETPARSTSLAGLQVTWVLGSAVVMLMLVVAAVALQRMWGARTAYGEKKADNYIAKGSVAYILPKTLVDHRLSEQCEDDESAIEEPTEEHHLRSNEEV